MLSCMSQVPCVVFTTVADGTSISAFGRRASYAMEAIVSGNVERVDSERAVLVLGKRVMHTYRGIPWQLYCQVCTVWCVCVEAQIMHSRAFFRNSCFLVQLRVHVAGHGCVQGDGATSPRPFLYLLCQ
jgi:hypothetical protein